MDNSAIVPENYQLNAEPIKDVEAQALVIAQDDERELGSLLYHKGFQRLAKSMEADIEKFRTGEFIKKPEELSLEEVGKLFVIHQTVATFLKGYLKQVEDSAKAVADAEQAKEPK